MKIVKKDEGFKSIIVSDGKMCREYLLGGGQDWSVISLLSIGSEISSELLLTLKKYPCAAWPEVLQK